MAVQTHALPLLGMLLQSAALVLLVLAGLWNHRRKRFGWSERALALQEPVTEERRRVRPFLRDGTVAPDPELARLTVRVAEHRVRRLENPWLLNGVSLNALGVSLFAIHYSYPGPALWVAFALFPAALSAPFIRQVTLDRARRALEANRELAELHEGSEEPPEHTVARER